MDFRRLSESNITRWEFIQYANLERMGKRSYASRHWLTARLKRLDTFACFQGEEMAAYLQIHPKHPYFGRCVYLDQYRPHYKYHTDEMLQFMICSALAEYPELPDGYFIAVDVERKAKRLQELYRSMGFRDSIARSALGEEYIVLIHKMGAFRERFFTK